MEKPRHITGIGETVLDIVLRDGEPRAAVPGGSVFNSMISLGRTLGRDCPEDVVLTMVSQTGDDPVADLVTGFMLRNNVVADGSLRAPGQSTVSLAFLGGDSNARYEFFRDPSLPPFRAPEQAFHRDDIVLFGSFFAVSPATGDETRAFIRRASGSGAIVYYDVNFRPVHQVERHLFEKNMALSDIVRASSEDILCLYGTDDAARVYSDHIAPLCPIFICTRGGGNATVFSPGVQADVPVAKVEKLVSTIGAGDNFNAGVIYALVKGGFTKDSLRALSAADWSVLASSGMAFASAVCGSLFNYVDPDFLK